MSDQLWNDPALEYEDEIFQNLFTKEKTKRPCDYLKENVYQDEKEIIKERMRTKLINWLLGVMDDHKLGRSSFFLGIAILDLFASKKPIKKSEYQMYGITCLWLGAKLEEKYTPTFDDAIYVSDNAFTKKQMAFAEADILITLGGGLLLPTPICFFKKWYLLIFRQWETFCKERPETPEAIQLTQSMSECNSMMFYLMELSTLLYEIIIEYFPSEICAVCIFLGIYAIFEDTSHIEPIKQYTGYDMNSDRLRECILSIWSSIPRNEPTKDKTTFLYMRYSSRFFNKVALKKFAIKPPL